MCPNMRSLHHVAALPVQQSSKGDAHVRDREVLLLPTTNLYTTNPNMFRLESLLQFLGQASEGRSIGVEIHYHLPTVC